jgi:hypothetical protein
MVILLSPQSLVKAIFLKKIIKLNRVKIQIKFYLSYSVSDLVFSELLCRFILSGDYNYP